MAAAKLRELTFPVEDRGEVSALYLRPSGADLAYVLAHGAGAGMRHRFMETIAARLADEKVATFRYQFPYMEQGRKRPDSAKIAQATVRAAVAAAKKAARGLPLIAGGKSFGGRMTSHAQATEPLPAVKALVFLGFPLHAPGKPGRDRAAHLADVKIPMLFLQGTRDNLADLALMKSVTRDLGRKAKIHVVEGGDHSFGVLKRSGRTEDEVMDELATTLASWSRSRL